MLNLSDAAAVTLSLLAGKAEEENRVQGVAGTGAGAVAKKIAMVAAAVATAAADSHWTTGASSAAHVQSGAEVAVVAAGARAGAEAGAGSSTPTRVFIFTSATGKKSPPKLEMKNRRLAAEVAKVVAQISASGGISGDGGDNGSGGGGQGYDGNLTLDIGHQLSSTRPIRGGGGGHGGDTNPSLGIGRQLSSTRPISGGGGGGGAIFLEERDGVPPGTTHVLVDNGEEHRAASDAKAAGVSSRAGRQRIRTIRYLSLLTIDPIPKTLGSVPWTLDPTP
jgi:hypothetical protein